jgi:hypothetical protein
MPIGTVPTFQGGMPGLEGSRLEPDYQLPYAHYSSNKSPTTAGRLLKAVDPVIQNGITAFGGKAAGPSVRSRAKKIALGAIDSYDPARGTLKNHLLTNLQGLRRVAAQSDQIIKAPERVALDKMTMDAAERELSDELGRDASPLEVADRTGLSLRRQAHIRGYVPGFAQGQVAGMGTSDDGEGFDPAVQQADPISAKLDFIYHDLDPVNQAIVDYGFGRNGRSRLPVGKIATKMNLTPGAISQRAAKIQAMLDELGDMEVF